MVYNPWGFVHVSLTQCLSTVSAIGIGVLSYSQPPVNWPKKLLCFLVQFITHIILVLLSTKKDWRCFACIHLLSKRIMILLLLLLCHLTKPDQPAIHYWTEKAKISLNLNSPFVVFFSSLNFINMPTFHLLNNWQLLNCKQTFHHLKSPQISLWPLLLHPWRATQ